MPFTPAENHKVEFAIALIHEIPGVPEEGH